mmetsp:Transcript_96731/g.276200  ORF Transcript_96731/g.276200 Transcript_96731/m.276200 type:complete len:284 (-) Transcript_96731:331-1182(-)
MVCVPYAFAIVPFFRTFSDYHQVIIRLTLHPLMLMTAEVLLREFARYQPTREQIPPFVRCFVIIAVDMFLQLIGRLLVASQDPTNTLGTASVLLIGIQEFVLRVSYVPKQRWIRKNIWRLPPFTAAEEAEYLGVLGIDNMSSMQSELSAILLATIIKIKMFEHRVVWDFGYAPSEDSQERSAREAAEIRAMFLALFVESLGNVLAMAVQKRQGVPHISSFAGNRYRETLLFVMAAQVMLTGSKFKPAQPRSSYTHPSRNKYANRFCRAPPSNFNPIFQSKSTE